MTLRRGIRIAHETEGKGARMDDTKIAEKDVTRMETFAAGAFLKVETFAYMVLGLLLALTALVGIAGAVWSLFEALRLSGAAHMVVLTVDRLLFVLMVVEILHTVRVSFHAGTLVAEPFLIVGLIASIRRVLVITLESSQATDPGKWTPDVQGYFNSTLMELGVLGGLILVMVVSIYMLRQAPRPRAGK
jgi:uncharacterized membrane protein (DUF373 family)